MKRFFRGYPAAVCMAFTASTLVYGIVAWSLGENSVHLKTLLSLLLLCLSGTAIQMVCFTDRLIRRMRYPRRMLLFGALFLPLISLCALIFHWFPTSSAAAWGVFLGVFIAVFALMTLIFEIHYYLAGKRYAGLLGAYRLRNTPPEERR